MPRTMRAAAPLTTAQRLGSVIKSWRDWNGRGDLLDGADGGLHNAMTGDQLLQFINQDEAIRPDGERGPGPYAPCSPYRRAASTAARQCPARRATSGDTPSRLPFPFSMKASWVHGLKP